MRLMPALAAALFAVVTATPVLAQEVVQNPGVVTTAPVQEDDDFPWGLLGLIGLAGLLGTRRRHDDHVAARRT